jgi:two-component system response regulator MprA
MPVTPRRGGRLLVVDDDRGTLQTFAQILTLEGYEVRTAASAEGGLRESQAWNPDAIILDFRMPLINGLGFLYRLRAGADRRNTPVVMVTGDCGLDDTTLGEIRELGANVHFKPLWVEDLIEVVGKLIADAPASWWTPPSDARLRH